MEIICFGDSITRGYDVPYGQGWVEICDASIENVHFTNYGEDGCSVQGMIYNIEEWASTAVADPTRHIFLMCGTNDILQGRDSTYVFKTLVKAIELASTKGKVIAEHDLKVIDFYTTLYEADQIGQIVFAGEVHPNARGYRLMAYKALEVFTRLS
ncbi:MAG: lipase [Veillonella sp.]|nr:lipase [Veillonella sp.]